jgi:hypothetical protein
VYWKFVDNGDWVQDHQNHLRRQNEDLRVELVDSTKLSTQENYLRECLRVYIHEGFPYFLRRDVSLSRSVSPSRCLAVEIRLAIETFNALAPFPEPIITLASPPRFIVLDD